MFSELRRISFNPIFNVDNIIEKSKAFIKRKAHYKFIQFVLIDNI